jgi:hypothetical protein
MPGRPLVKLKEKQARIRAVDKTIRVVTDFKEQQAETYRYWRSVPVGERLNAIMQLSKTAYTMRGLRFDDGQRPARDIVRVERP